MRCVLQVLERLAKPVRPGEIPNFMVDADPRKLPLKSRISWWMPTRGSSHWEAGPRISQPPTPPTTNTTPLAPEDSDSLETWRCPKAAPEKEAKNKKATRNLELMGCSFGLMNLALLSKASSLGGLSWQNQWIASFSRRLSRSLPQNQRPAHPEDERRINSDGQIPKDQPTGNIRRNIADDVESED